MNELLNVPELQALLCDLETVAASAQVCRSSSGEHVSAGLLAVLNVDRAQPQEEGAVATDVGGDS